MKNRAPLVVFDVRPLQCGYAQRGIGRYTRELLLALQARLAGKPARYRLRSLAFPGELPAAAPPAVFRAPRWERVWLWDQGVLPWKLRLSGATIFHSCAAMGPLKEVNFPAMFAPHCVLTVHDWHAYAEDASPLERFYRSTRRMRWQLRQLRRAGRVVVDAACVGEEAAQRFGVPPERISLVAPGGDHLDAVPESPPAETGFVLSIGDGPHKGLRTAYRAMVSARAQGLACAWTVVGDPQRVRACLQFESALPAWVRICSQVGDSELKGLYRAAACLLFPSPREGFGFPALEAMRLGCPVLAADAEPVRSLVGFPESMFAPEDVAEFAGALRRLATDPEWRARVIAHGRERARAYTWKQTADRVLEVWDRLS